jgi:ABC-2 type transport system ATP-binding protein
LLVEGKDELMRKLGKKQLTLQLPQALTQIPAALEGYALSLSADGHALTFTYDAHDDAVNVPALLQAIQQAGLRFTDIQTSQSSLEDIFVNLLKGGA